MSEIKPALTAEEWAPLLENEMQITALAHQLMRDTLAARWTTYIEGRADHAFAALALHGQSFGFTWEDVGLLREAVILDPNERMTTEYDDEGMAALRALADRIAALLPPRE